MGFEPAGTTLKPPNAHTVDAVLAATVTPTTTTIPTTLGSTTTLPSATTTTIKATTTTAPKG
jgi:hypothetical protein